MHGFSYGAEGRRSRGAQIPRSKDALGFGSRGGMGGFNSVRFGTRITMIVIGEGGKEGKAGARIFVLMGQRAHT
jgi:hypothetical protein